MANNTYVNKVIFGGDTLIDLSNDDVARASVLNGKYFHLPTGERTTGTCTYDADTSDADASTDDILSGKTAYKNGSKLTGTMTNQGEKHLTITDRDTAVTIPAGYHDGSGDIGLGSSTTITPSTTSQTIQPSDLGDYNSFSAVTISAIAYTETDNPAGGKTATIGTVAPST